MTTSRSLNADLSYFAIGMFGVRNSTRLSPSSKYLSYSIYVIHQSTSISLYICLQMLDVSIAERTHSQWDAWMLPTQPLCGCVCVCACLLDSPAVLFLFVSARAPPPPHLFHHASALPTPSPSPSRTRIWPPHAPNRRYCFSLLCACALPLWPLTRCAVMCCAVYLIVTVSISTGSNICCSVQLQSVWLHLFIFYNQGQLYCKSLVVGLDIVNIDKASRRRSILHFCSIAFIATVSIKLHYNNTVFQ